MMELKQLNEILQNLRSPDKKKLTFVEKQNIRLGVTGNPNYNGEGEQGEEDNYYRIYRINDIPDTYLRVEYTTDSYGDNESVRGVTFVKAKEKIILTYEPI